MDEQLGFDGAKDLSRAWLDGLLPDPALTISEWADRHRVLSSRDSAEPGRYRTDRTPYMRAITDGLSPGHPARRVVFMKSAQVTELQDRWLPRPRIAHPWPNKRFAVKHPRWKPGAGNPLAGICAGGAG